MKTYVIRAIKDDHDYDQAALFWSNEYGWTDFESASRFYEGEQKELNLPICGEWVRVPQRFKNAAEIQKGAVNPAGMARTLAEACSECLDEGVSQKSDPAVRLIVHQLAFICNTRELDVSLSAYRTATDKCERMLTHPDEAVFIPER